MNEINKTDNEVSYSSSSTLANFHAGTSQFNAECIVENIRN